MKKHVMTAAALMMTVATMAAPTQLEISPTVFDFGWSPDNAKVSCEFVVKNVGTDMIPLTAVQPTCGCTASQFTPGALSSQEERKISLTFNTRGYANMAFNKTAKVKTDLADSEYSVAMKGRVTDANAQVVPVGDGIVGFPPGSKEKKKTIQIQNKSANDVRLDIVQNPAAWANVKLAAQNVPAGKMVDMTVSIDGKIEDMRDTSITLAAVGPSEESRLTIAIRTGNEPAPYRTYQPPKPTETQPAPAKK